MLRHHTQAQTACWPTWNLHPKELLKYKHIFVSASCTQSCCKVTRWVLTRDPSYTLWEIPALCLVISVPDSSKQYFIYKVLQKLVLLKYDQHPGKSMANPSVLLSAPLLKKQKTRRGCAAKMDSHIQFTVTVGKVLASQSTLANQNPLKAKWLKSTQWIYRALCRYETI